MLIVGNSHVQLFVSPPRTATVGRDPVQVVWVGQPMAANFVQQKPDAELTRSLFERYAGSWKILVMGDIDVSRSLWRDSHEGAGSGLREGVKEYEALFDELNQNGKFAWMLGPQVRRLFPGLPDWHREVHEAYTSGQIWARAREFHALVGRSCADRGIPVINPTAEFIDADGTSRPGHFRDDDSHLLPEYVRYYVDEIEAKLGVRIDVSLDPAVADPGAPRDLQAYRTRIRHHLSRTRVREHVVRKLASAGLDIELTDDTDFAPFFDSLGLVEVYTRAGEAVEIQLGFDVDLREISTVNAMVGYLFSQKTGPRV